ncbi:MAG: methyl-accepting chemotaxis protein [Agathobacter sp.]|nr:methyl-accepting chemotaxis protein [Agathobacter sp.]
MEKVSIRLRMIFSYIVIALAVVILVATLIYNATSEVMTNKVGVLITAINDETRLNVNNYMKDIEDVSSLIFAEEDVRNYDPLTTDLSEYDAIQLENSIKSDLLYNSVLHNYGDFVIIYSNDHTIGRISTSTTELLGEDNRYNTVRKYIDDEIKEDGWFTGVNDNFKRLYYVKRIHKSAILLASTYTSEFETVMKFSDQLADLNVMIVSDEKKVIYSNIPEQIGSEVDKEISSRCDEESHSCFISDGELVTTNTCGDNWYIISQIPTVIVLKELGDVRNATIIVAFISVVLAILMGIFFSRTITKPIKLLMQVMSKAEKGDLTTRAKFPAGGEILSLTECFNSMMMQIDRLLEQVENMILLVESNASEIGRMSSDSAEISKNITIAMEGIAQGSQEQFLETQKTFDSLEELAESINSTVSNVVEVNEKSKITKEIGESSIEHVGSLSEKTKISNESLAEIKETFELLGGEVKKIEGVLDFIAEVSEETNLLSLNASIEASKAGEAGKGFSVVAGEVSKLANQTQDSTQDINRVIRQIRMYVTETVDKLEASRHIFEEQNKMVQDTIESFSEIVSSNDSISEHIETIGNIADGMNALKDNSLEATKSILSIAESASANTEEVMSATFEELETSEKLAEKSQLLQKSIDELKVTMNQFILHEEDEEDEEI